MIFVRDCFFHLSEKQIKDSINNIKRSGCNYIMTTNFLDRSNYEIYTGFFRPISLENHPYNFPNPILRINDTDFEDKDLKYQDRHMAMWKVEDLPKF